MSLQDTKNTGFHGTMIDLTWLGTAGFIVRTHDAQFAFDPFLSRKNPNSPFDPSKFADVSHIFLGHGHFDHAFDVPEILNHTEACAYAPGLTGMLLKWRGAPSDRVLGANPAKYLLEAARLRAFKSEHVVFDRKLIETTAQRCGFGGCAHVLRLGIEYPKGLVQTYVFESRGKKVLFMSSAGCTTEELKIYRDLEVDVLLMPLQGHSEIHQIAARMAAAIAPKLVIPHHHDDFYPPMSQAIGLDEFKLALQQHSFRGAFKEIQLFDSAQI